MEPKIIDRDQHPVSRKHFSEAALKVLYRLNTKGYLGYLAGGAVRDILLDRDPKDFDVVTDARPNQIRKVFRNSRMIGRRFRLAHIFFHDEIIECSTFRRQVDDTEEQKSRHFDKNDGMVVRDNMYGSPEEDAVRRDFTVNALYYDIQNFSIIDYVDGMRDMEARLIRSIGDPLLRYTEDPVRMIRAIRFAAKLDFRIEEQTYQAIKEKRMLIRNASPARMYEEIQKLFICGNAVRLLKYLEDTGLLEAMFPELSEFVAKDSREREWLRRAAQQFDKWRAAGKVIGPNLIFGLLFGPLCEAQAAQCKGGDPISNAKKSALQEFNSMRERVVIPKNVKYAVGDMLADQILLSQSPRGKKSKRLVRRRGFAEALVYFKLRSRHSGRNNKQVEAWESLVRN